MGIQPTGWGVALQVMLEKIAGVCLVNKLHSMQLYEANYNWFNKFVSSDIMLRILTSWAVCQKSITANRIAQQRMHAWTKYYHLISHGRDGCLWPSSL